MLEEQNKDNGLSLVWLIHHELRKMEEYICLHVDRDLNRCEDNLAKIGAKHIIGIAYLDSCLGKVIIMYKDDIV